MHGFTDKVFAQHRTDHGEAVTGAGERRTAGALEVDIAQSPVDVGDLAEQEGTTVAEQRRVPAELVPGVGLGHRGGAFRDPVADQHQRPLGRPKGRRIQAQLTGQGFIQDKELRRRCLLGLPGNSKLLEFPGEAAVKGERCWGCGAHVSRLPVPATAPAA